MGPENHPRGRSGVRRRISRVSPACPHTGLFPVARCQRAVRADDAELDDAPARRKRLVRRLPRTQEQHARRAGWPPQAIKAGPQSLIPFYGEPRGFSFSREIQPILDRHCVSCHSGPAGDSPSLTSQEIVDGTAKRRWTEGYLNLTHARPDEQGAGAGPGAETRTIRSSTGSAPSRSIAAATLLSRLRAKQADGNPGRETRRCGIEPRGNGQVGGLGRSGRSLLRRLP